MNSAKNSKDYIKRIDDAAVRLQRCAAIHGKACIQCNLDLSQATLGLLANGLVEGILTYDIKRK